MEHVGHLTEFETFDSPRVYKSRPHQQVVGRRYYAGCSCGWCGTKQRTMPAAREEARREHPQALARYGREVGE